MPSIADRLQNLGIALPVPAKPLANYVPYVIDSNMLYIAGQLPLQRDMQPPKPVCGVVGQDLSIELATAAACLCAIEILAQAQAALGSLERIKRVIKLGGFVRCGADFADHATVINGASQLLADILGDKAPHARFAVGASSLPLGAAVEIDAIIAIDIS